MCSVDGLNNFAIFFLKACFCMANFLILFFPTRGATLENLGGGGGGGGEGGFKRRKE